jgi:thiol-disulfide isomerase/thioredoxin
VQERPTRTLPPTRQPARQQEFDREARERAMRERLQRQANQPLTPTVQQVERQWLQPMPSIDRTMMEALVGFTPPEFADDLAWHGHNPVRDGNGQPEWLHYRDRIVVVQSWTSANRAGRQAMTDAIAAVSEFSANDVALLLLHTPEGHQGAAEHVEHASKPNVSIVVDSTGKWSDELGIYRTPVNFIVDRNGVVRFAGLNSEGIVPAIQSIIDDEYDEHEEVAPLPPMQQRLNVAFPTTRGNTGRTPDIHGQVGPDVYVPEWFNDPPASLRGKVIKVEFWRTGCPPCINAIPKLNETIERFGDDVVIVAITHERPQDIRQGLSRRNVDPDGLRYTIGVDPQRRTATQMNVQGVPHSIVMSYDGIVRWQGHPAGLADETLEQIIRANNALYARTQLDERRWVKN